MVHTIEVLTDRFLILQKKPNAWQLVVDKDLNVVKGDTINVVEVDALGQRTGRNRIGKVYFVGSPLGFEYTDNNEMAFITCALGIGFDQIHSSFLVS